MVNETDARRFSEITDEETAAAHTGTGFGVLNEKRMHRIIRRYVLDDPSKWERTLPDGSVADVFDGSEAYEIQTASLYPLAAKLRRVADTTGVRVTVVHPVPAVRRIIKIMPDGSVGEPKKSPAHGTVWTLLAESVYVAELIAGGRVRLRALFIEEDEYRTVTESGRKISRVERMPVALLDDITFSSGRDFLPLLGELPDSFSRAEFVKISRLRGRNVYRALRAMQLLGIITRTEPGVKPVLFGKTDSSGDPDE